MSLADDLGDVPAELLTDTTPAGDAADTVASDAAATLAASDAGDSVAAGDGRDTVAGDDTGDTTSGAAADDTLTAAGDDTLAAGDAGDTLAASDAADTLAAGAGADTSSHQTKPEAITDPTADIESARTAHATALQERQAAESMYDNLPDDEFLTAGQLKAQRTAIAAAESKMRAAEQTYQTATQKQQQFAEQQNTAFWSGWEKTSNGIPAGEGQKLFETEYANLAKQYPGRDVTVAALEKANAKARAIVTGRQARQGKPAATPTTPKPPVTRGGGSIIPKGAAGARPPAPKAKSAADEVFEKFGAPEKLGL
jgi:Ca2+-binding RTX toxin-like protein